MPEFNAPLRDMRFVLHEVFAAPQLWARLPALAETVDADTADAILEEAAKVTGTLIAPLNRSGDEEGAQWAGGEVRTPTGFREAYATYSEGGWVGLSGNPQYGGMGMPKMLAVAFEEMLYAAGSSFALYSALSSGACLAIDAHASEDLKTTYLPPMYEGRWAGSMCLTEAHAGTDLGIIRTRAEPQADGSYAVSGTKIFITGGEHDLTDNIVHLVLARLPDAPAGTKGISLFIVPKAKVARDGTVGERNAVRCGSIEHKMGIHGSATCVMNFDGAQGWLIGQPNKGLNAMFTMMNSARLAVGIQGLGLIDRAYQNALAYSRDRLQMRSLSGPKRPDKPADPLIVHPDIRRMLLTCKAFAESGRALALHAASLVDLVDKAQTPEARAEADALLSFLTPIVKGVLTEASVECTYHALQCFGGHGYVREWGMEQLARDARITTIYEGTTQIQALDLLGRKVIQQQGAGFKLFLGMIVDFCSANTGRPEMAEFIAPLAQAAQDWQQLTMEIAQRVQKNPEELGAAAVDYLFYSGYVTLAYWSARAVAAADGGAHADDFRHAKRETARFYFKRLLPRTLAHAATIRAGSDSLMALDETLFAIA